MHLEVWCDELNEAYLLLYSGLADRLYEIFRNLKICIIPKPIRGKDELRIPKYLYACLPLVRPDLIITYNNDVETKPILSIEIADHVQTGDHAGQRFARLLEAIEAKIPVIFFTPFIRIKLEDQRPRFLNPRVVNAAINATDVYGIPIFLINWPIDESYITLKGVEAFSELNNLINHIVSEHRDEIWSGEFQNIWKKCQICSGIMNSSKKFMSEKAKDRALGYTDVIQEKDTIFLKEIINNPHKIVSDYLGESYFQIRGIKGVQRRIARDALLRSRIQIIEDRDGKKHVIEDKDIDYLWRSIPEIIRNRPKTVFYFHGSIYDKQPHLEYASTLLFHFDIQKEIEPKNREKNLIFIWPRVFLDEKILCERFPLDCKEGILKGKGNRQMNVWTVNRKESRILRKYCDLIILNDTILLGGMHKSEKMEKNVFSPTFINVDYNRDVYGTFRRLMYLVKKYSEPVVWYSIFFSLIRNQFKILAGSPPGEEAFFFAKPILQKQNLQYSVPDMVAFKDNLILIIECKGKGVGWKQVEEDIKKIDEIVSCHKQDIISLAASGDRDISFIKCLGLPKKEFNNFGDRIPMDFVVFCLIEGGEVEVYLPTEVLEQIERNIPHIQKFKRPLQSKLSRIF